MSRRFDAYMEELAERRRLLVLRTRLQRLELQQACRGFDRPMHWLGVMLKVVALLSLRPRTALVTAAAATLAAAGLARWRTFFVRAATVYQLGKFLRARLTHTAS